MSWLRRSPPKPLPVYCFSCGEPMRWVKYVMGDKFNEHTGQPNPPDWEYYECSDSWHFRLGGPRRKLR